MALVVGIFGIMVILIGWGAHTCCRKVIKRQFYEGRNPHRETRLQLQSDPRLDKPKPTTRANELDGHHVQTFPGHSITNAPKFDSVYFKWQAGAETQKRARVPHYAPAGAVRV